MDSAILSTTLQTYIHQLRKLLTLPELVARLSTGASDHRPEIG